MNLSESLLMRRIAERTEKKVAQDMGLSTSQLNRIFNGQAGITLEHLPAFLAAVDISCMDANTSAGMVEVSRRELDALRALAALYLDKSNRQRGGE